MARVKISTRSFLRRYQERTKAFGNLVIALPDRPSPDQIHDLRVATRRAGVLYRLLPREVRGTEEARSFNFALRSVRKATSRVRDMDTLKDNLDELKAFLPGGLLVSMDNERSDAAAHATKDLPSIRGTPAPAVEPSMLGKKRLARRLNKKVEKRRSVLGRLAKKVAADESRIEELHALRVEAKKLRYLLELVKEPSDEVKALARWQDALGEIHDLDVAMAYLQGSSWDFPKEPALRQLRRDRRVKYAKFVHDYQMRRAEVARGNGGARIASPQSRPDA